MIIFSSKKAHIIIAKACSGIFGIMNIQLKSSITANKNINICENVCLPTLMHVTKDTIGSKSRNGIIQNMKKFFGKISVYLHFG